MQTEIDQINLRVATLYPKPNEFWETLIYKWLLNSYTDTRMFLQG
jgi:hypothetical protein